MECVRAMALMHYNFLLLLRKSKAAVFSLCYFFFRSEKKVTQKNAFCAEKLARSKIACNF